MKTQLLGSSDLEISRLAYGCMRIAGTWERTEVTADSIKRGKAAIAAAVDAGYTFFDHADIYGDTTCESIFGEALQENPGWRKNMVIATKCGIRFEDEPTPGLPHRYDFSYDHIIWSVEESLKRLRIERIDLLMLHRPDFLADPNEIAQAFTELREAGKVHEFGVSNFRPSLLSMVQSALPFALQANQVEIHPFRLDAFTDGTIDQCQEHEITPMSWSPLAGGKVAAGAVADASQPNFDQHTVLLAALDAAAKEYDCDRTVMALAWLLRHPSEIVPVVGSTNPENIRIAAKAAEMEIDRETWYRILRAARGVKLP